MIVRPGIPARVRACQARLRASVPVVRRVCVCGHMAVFHKHYRAGSNCSHVAREDGQVIRCSCAVWRWRGVEIRPREPE